uniref:Transglutaminase-like domain-containing protein n=1 Tax=Candidatus Methanomethylicus mesodigestus TaxID=1867258 RepID=A0A7C3J4A4_9CREN
MAMNKTIIITSILVVIFAGMAGMTFINSQMVSAQVDSLKAQLVDLQSSYSTLQNSHNRLQSEFNSLQTAYGISQSDLAVVQQQYDGINSAYNQLTNSIYQMRDNLKTYSDLTFSFSRVFSSNEYHDISSAVAIATGNNKDGWSSYQKIYNYIHNHIKYAYDVSAIILSYSSVTSTSGPLAGRELVTGISFQETNNYVQTPRQTLNLKQGDCEDQAVLCYMMIKYHMTQIQGTNYNLYLAEIRFNDGSGHVAVFLPVINGQLCIIDNAGNYLTSNWGSITQRNARTELHNYSNYWSSTSGIKSLTLYSVSANGGSYTVFATGSIDQVASALGA